MNLKHILSSFLMGMLILFAMSCSKSSNPPETPPPGGGSSTSFNIDAMAFPGDITVKKGATVTWTNKDTYPHTVTSDDGTSFSSGTMATGAVFSYTAKTVGSFTYHCTFHSNMKGKLIVTP